VSTVRWAMTRSSAIWRLVRPWAIRWGDFRFAARQTIGTSCSVSRAMGEGNAVEQGEAELSCLLQSKDATREPCRGQANGR